MVKRYELSEGQWDRVKDLLPGKAGDPGRSGRDNRQFVNGVLWVLRSGARWHDLPERDGKGKSDKPVLALAKAGSLASGRSRSSTRDRDNQDRKLDTTPPWAHQQAAPTV